MMTAPWGRYYTIACWHRRFLPYWASHLPFSNRDSHRLFLPAVLYFDRGGRRYPRMRNIPPFRAERAGSIIKTKEKREL